MSTFYYNIITDRWREGKVGEAFSLFKRYKEGGLLNQEEIEDLSKKIPDDEELLFQQLEELEENPDLMRKVRQLLIAELRKL